MQARPDVKICLALQYHMADALYVHIPFCIRKCLYCDFLSLPYQAETAHRYVQALCRELEMRREEAETFRTIYVGGGTPSILEPGYLVLLFETIRKWYAISRDAEITVEMNPGTLDREKARILLASGVNRVSLGVQSFRDDELKTLGRIHSADEATRAVALLKDAGFTNLSLDLIYGIPGQTRDSWNKTLLEATALSPQHVSAYELTPEKGTPLQHLLDAGRISLLPEETVLEMSELCVDLLSQAGLERYEVSNFAVPGAQCAHNLNYWHRGEYLGIGAGAHSFLRGIRWNNSCDLGSYVDTIEGGLLPEEEREVISTKEAARELLFLGLRRTDGISLSEAGAVGLDMLPAAEEFLSQGLAEHCDGRLRLTARGLSLLNAVLLALYERLGL